MKKFLIVLSILSIFTVAILTNSSSTFAYAKIIVTGKGEICLPPDTAIITVGVENYDEDLLSAQTQNSKGINKLVDVLKELGILDEDIKTKIYYVNEKYDFSNGEKLVGYQISSYLEFKTTDVDNVGNIVDKLIENGANRFQSVVFTLENYENAYKQALNFALEDAKNKAYVLYNKELEIKKILEEKQNIIYFNDNFRYANSTEEATKFMKGNIKVSALLTVEFEFEKDDITSSIESEKIKNLNTFSFLENIDSNKKAAKYIAAFLFTNLIKISF